MPLSPEQLWIAKFTGGVTLSVEEQGELSLDDQLELQQQIERRQELILRETYIRRAHQEAEALSGELEVFRRARIATRSGKMDMIGKGGDQTQAFGYQEDIGSVKSSPQELAAMTNAKGKVIAIQKGLQAVTVQRSYIDREQGRLATQDAPLFEDRDIENELFTPLVRSLLFPEDQVADEFSATQRMIDGSNQYYIDELVTRSEESGTSAEEWGNVLKSVTTAIKDVTSASVGLVAQVDLSGTTSSEKALEILKTRDLVNLGLMVGEAVVNTAIDVGVQISKGDAASGVSVVLSGLSGAVGGLVKQFTGDANLAKYVAAGMKGGSRIPKMIAAFLGEDAAEQKAGKFLEQLGGLWGDAFDITAVATNDKSDPNNTENQKQIALIKLGITTAYAGVSSALKAGVIAKIEKRDWNGLAQIVVSTAGTVVKGGLDGVAIEQMAQEKAAITPDSVRSEILKNHPEMAEDPKLEELIEKTKTDKLTAVDTKFASTATRVDTATSGLVQNLNSLIAQGKGDEDDPIALKIKEREAAAREEQEKACRSSVEEAEKRIRDEEAAFGETLRLMGKDEFTETDLKSIGKLIAQMQRDRMIMQTASAIGGAGFAIASQFFAPMAIAGTIIKFIEALTAAVNRAIELRNWVDASGKALNAVSPYLTAIQSFVKNQAEQFSHYTIKCALLAVQVAAQIVQVAGAGTYAQAVGLVVEKGAKLAETIEELSYKFYKEATLIHAWKVTKPALKDPKNRKANLIARRLNPTLAKYTLAYGAVIDKDPVALQAFNIIGLNAETLAARDAKVDTVKTYLETRYNEDVQVYKSFAVDKEDSWLKKAPAPALTVDCFVTLHILAVEKGGVEDTKPNAITAAFRTAEQRREAHAEAVRLISALDPITPEGLQPHRQTFDAHEAACQELAALLRSFKPPRKDASSPNADLQDALAELAELADVEADTIALEIANLFGQAVQLPPEGPPPDPKLLQQQLEAVAEGLNAGK